MLRMMLAFSLAAFCVGQTAAADDRYVTASTLNVRLCPAQNCPITNKIYRGQKVNVYETENGWSRISEYYDSDAERLEFPQIQEEQVARWVASSYLSVERPEKASQPKFEGALSDPRIRGIPEVGEYGLTHEDILVLRTYAAELLATGECTGIEYGDKSTFRKNTYYVHCDGESQNRFFKR